MELEGADGEGFLFYYFGGDSLTGRGTSGEGMVIEDKGMRLRDWCLCVCFYGAVWVSVSWGGRMTGEGLGSLGSL